jgi:hypothetical protein
MKKRLTMIQGPMAGMTVEVDEPQAAIENMLDTGYAEEAPPEPVLVEEKPEPKAEPAEVKEAEPKKKPARKRRKRKMETPEG